MRAHVLAAALVGIASAVACVQFPDRGPYSCSSDADCLSDETCSNGACVVDGSAGSGGSNAGGSGGSGGSGGDPCTARSCTELGCGVHQECGEQVDCGPCRCTPQNFATVCPQRPCEVVNACVNEECQYAPLACGGLVCRPVTTCGGDDCAQFCTATGCSSGLYACGPNQLCEDTTRFCDPRPDGEGGYGNACVGPLPPTCGTCELGARDCQGNQIACADLPHADGPLECDSTLTTSSFLFVDATRSPEGADGSRDRPFPDVDAALDAAVARGAVAVVIGGSPTFTKPLVLRDGVSVHGGFGPAPGFIPDPQEVPVWQVDASAIDPAVDTLLAGAIARDIESPTWLSGVEVRTANLSLEHVTPAGQGLGNVALLAVNTPALHVLDSTFVAGAGAPGRQGADGAPLGPEAVGGAAREAQPGAAPEFCFKELTCTGPDGRACGSGGNGAAVDRSGNLEPGEAGDPKGVFPGGEPGKDANISEITCVPLKFADATAGAPGVNAKDGASGSPGRAGARSALDPTTGALVFAPATDGGDGNRGAWGSGGGAGGGHPDVCSCKGRCPGGDGGGGGAPGCGGLKGMAGGAGGPSIAVAALGSSGLELLRCTLQAGSGGDGGRGGVGSAGARGGPGETRGRCPRLSECPQKTPNIGGAGGNGATGGPGGNAGGGAAGDSIALYCAAGAVTPEGSTVTPGKAGAPGDGRDANAGEAGVSVASLGCE